MSDMKRTPDIRTRAVCVEWCARAKIKYLADRFTDTAIVNLVARAGIVSGWGDARQEKGARSEGLWEVVNEKNENWQRIAKTQGRAVQDVALKTPEFLDHVSESLFAWYLAEVERRGRREKAGGSIDIRSRANGGASEVDAAVVASVRGRAGKRGTAAEQST
jgi:hypothetical protein